MCSRLVVDLRQSWEPNQRIVVVVIYIRGWQNMQDVTISLRRRDVRAAACKMCTATLQREQEHRHRFDGKHDVPEGSSPKRTSRCTRRARHHKLAINTAAMRRVASRSLYSIPMVPTIMIPAGTRVRLCGIPPGTIPAAGTAVTPGYGFPPRRIHDLIPSGSMKSASGARS